jgi:hypothetical protein
MASTAPKRFSVIVPCLGALALVVTSAGAVGTRTFVLDTQDELTGGDLKGVTVGSDGVVRPGFTLGNVAIDGASAVFAGLARADGSVLLGTSPSGRVVKVAGDQATVFAETGALAVTSIAEDARGNAYAATIPDGKIFKISQGKADLFVALPDTTHVWALAFDKTKTVMYAATGPEGRVYRIDAAGKAEVFFKSEELQLVSVAVGAGGEVYAGSSGKALLYKITAPGRASVLYDFPGEEVKSIAIAPSGDLFALSNEYGEQPDVPRRTAASGHAAAAAAATAKPKPGKGTLTRIDAAGRPEQLMHHSEFHYVSLALDAAGHPYVGTGAEGRVYTVDDTHATTLVVDTDERAIGAIGLGSVPIASAKSFAGMFFAGSDTCNLHRVVGRGGPDAVWTSKAFDAGLPAKFGTLSWRSTGALEMSIRTGNTQAPDTTWTSWSNPLQTPGPVAVASGRFVQVRARFSADLAAQLTDVTIPFATDNLRPVVTSVDAAMKGLVRDTKEGIQASGGDPPKHESIVKVSWRVDNPDSDALRYRLSYRREEQKNWRDLSRADEVVTKTEYDWETAALAEGKYRVRIEASDEGANAPDQALRHAHESSAVLVDNTPPTITVLTLAGRRLKARVVDGLGPVSRVEIAIDGKLEWRPIAPIDGLFDAADESFDVDAAALIAPGSHIVAVRAFDAAGNAVVREIESQ